MLTITIETNNDAFYEQPGYNCAHILRALADKVETHQSGLRYDGPRYDFNGNKCGEYVFGMER